jgi:2-keto-4-pentenoate hydratase/2-oxohepta-3-ene-1,7-dioic acid hydratase in catechol pathway
MRLINANGRAGLAVSDTTYLDVAEASDGKFGPDLPSIYAAWEAFTGWAAAAPAAEHHEVDTATLGAPSPQPRQVFAVGLNYRAHAEESGAGLPTAPMVFTKFPSSITGPYAEIVRPEGKVDWEVELVAVIGLEARGVAADHVWSYVAGLTAGQDLSERVKQLAPPAPQQFNLGKSHEGFGPIGPQLVTPDEFADPDDVEISCSVNGVEMQRTRTADLIFGIPAIVEYLSSIVTLYPGDVIFTGTPGGVGLVRTPPIFLHPGDVLETTVEGVGTMRHTFVPPR